MIELMILLQKIRKVEYMKFLMGRMSLIKGIVTE